MTDQRAVWSKSEVQATVRGSEPAELVGAERGNRSNSSEWWSGEQVELFGLWATALALLDLLTILGNLLVCVAVLKNRRLHSVTYYLVLIQALYDFLLGFLVLPFSSIHTLNNSVWPFGFVACNLWVSTDVLLCTLSILNLLVISMERYFAVAKPFFYQRHAKLRYVVVATAVEVVLSVLASFVPIFSGLNTEDGRMQNADDPARCSLQGSRTYVLVVATVTFFIPLILVCGANFRILFIARRQATKLKGIIVRHDNGRAGTGHSKGSTTGDGARWLGTKRDTQGEQAGGQLVPLSAGSRVNSLSPDGRNSIASSTSSKGRLRRMTEQGIMLLHRSRRGSRAWSNDHKASIMLAGVVLAFAICWTPYFVVFTVAPFVGAPAINQTLFMLCYWLGMCNSVFNPFLYALLNSEFRLTFRVILTCQGNAGLIRRPSMYDYRRQASAS